MSTRLLRLGANPNVKFPTVDSNEFNTVLQSRIQDLTAKSLLEFIAEYCIVHSGDPAHLAMFELLLQHGAVAYPRKGQIGEWDSEPMAHVFILKQRSDMLKTLLRHHPDFVFSRNAEGLTPLHIAAAGRDLDAVQLLIDHGADVNARCISGETPFLSAFCYRSDLPQENADDATCQLVEKSLEIGHVLGAFGADTTARRSWPFAPPERIFLEYDPEDAFRSCPLTFADDAFTIRWCWWAIRRNLHNDIGTCGNVLFLRPSIISSWYSLEIPFLLWHQSKRPHSQGFTVFPFALGSLVVNIMRCHSCLHFMGGTKTSRTSVAWILGRFHMIMRAKSSLKRRSRLNDELTPSASRLIRAQPLR